MKVMLSKTEFCDHIRGLQRESDALVELYNKYNLDMIECSFMYSSSHFDKLLAKLMFDEPNDILGTDIGWWCWECDFGRAKDGDGNLMSTIYNDDESIYKEIPTPEDLYDYLKERAEGDN